MVTHGLRSSWVTQVELFSFVFWENWWHQKDILKLTGLFECTDRGKYYVCSCMKPRIKGKIDFDDINASFLFLKIRWRNWGIIWHTYVDYDCEVFKGGTLLKNEHVQRKLTYEMVPSLQKLGPIFYWIKFFKYELRKYLKRSNNSKCSLSVKLSLVSIDKELIQFQKFVVENTI